MFIYRPIPEQARSILLLYPWHRHTCTYQLLNGRACIPYARYKAPRLICKIAFSVYYHVLIYT